MSVSCVSFVGAPPWGQMPDGAESYAKSIAAFHAQRREGPERAHTVNCDFSLRALAAPNILRRRKNQRRRAAAISAIRESRSIF